MQKITLVLVVAFVLGCSKPIAIYEQDCQQLVKGSDSVAVCLQKVLSDSRCPPNAECVWEGYVLASFVFTMNGVSYPIELATKKIEGITRKDTTLQGYRVEFLALTSAPGSSRPEASISLTQQ